MDRETLFALAAIATIVGTLWVVGADIVRLVAKGRNARRGETQEGPDVDPENK